MADVVPVLDQAVETLDKVKVQADSPAIQAAATDLAGDLSARIVHIRGADISFEYATFQVVLDHLEAMRRSLYQGDLSEVLSVGEALISALPGDPQTGRKR
jgi:hypothetical protein